MAKPVFIILRATLDYAQGVNPQPKDPELPRYFNGMLERQRKIGHVDVYSESSLIVCAEQ